MTPFEEFWETNKHIADDMEDSEQIIKMAFADAESTKGDDDVLKLFLDFLKTSSPYKLDSDEYLATKKLV